MSMYVASRKVDSFDSLMSLLVADRIKSTLSESCLRHVLSVEATTETGWLHVPQLGECIDFFRANHNSNDKPRAGAIGMTASNASRVGSGVQRQPHRRGYSGEQLHPKKNLNSKLVCYKCKGFGHTRKFCPTNRQSMNANRCTIQVGDSPETSDLLTSAGTSVVDDTGSEKPRCETSCDFDSQYVYDYQCYRGFVSLRYVDVVVDELNTDGSVRRIRALEDSGTELTIIKSSIFGSVVLPKIGRVHLRGIVGKPVEADLVKLHISLDRSMVGSVPIVCPVCAELNEDMIFTAALVNQLRGLCSGHVDHSAVSDEMVQGEVVQAYDFACGSENLLDVKYETETVSDIDISVAGVAQVTTSYESEQQAVIEDSASEPDNQLFDYKQATVNKFRIEQQNDDSLKPCWRMAEHGKGGFVIHNELLCHVQKIESVGVKLPQLCLPASRRRDVLDLAHCTIGAHQAYRRTHDRVRLSFSWPTSSADTKKFCSECDICQKRARVTVWDRTPITAVPRSQYAFQQFYADCAGHYFRIRKIRLIIIL